MFTLATSQPSDFQPAISYHALGVLFAIAFAAMWLVVIVVCAVAAHSRASARARTVRPMHRYPTANDRHRARGRR